ncbi:MAG: OmpW family protein, partial [Rhodospirillaceae bacterium]|nr:OmpW family protein [Rhodospirillaceae bacterium]
MVKLSHLGGIGLLAFACLGSAPVQADDFKQAGEWLVRGRVIGVLPDGKSTITPIGGNATADDSFVPELDISYFFSDNIALEVIAAVTKHDVTARGTTLGTVRLGDAWLLPPIVTLQYHASSFNGLSPYVGVGLNYTHFFDADTAGAPVTAISYGDSFGPALQAGFDVQLNDRWSFNVDVKKVWINTDVRI